MAWLERLPQLVETARQRWDLQLGEPFPGAKVAYVVPATACDGTPCVLKLSFMTEETRGEAAALRHWGSEVCVDVLDESPEPGALLLERLQPGRELREERPGARDQLRVLKALLPRLWAPAVPEVGTFPIASQILRSWTDDVMALTHEAELSDLAERVLDRASSLMTPDLRPAGHAVLANQDLHGSNVLSARRQPWLVIDPKPVVGEAAMDCGCLARELLRRASLDQAPVIVRSLTFDLGVDEKRVRTWAALRSLVNASWEISHGYGNGAREVACARAFLS